MSAPDGAELHRRCEQALDFAGQQLERLVKTHPGYFPMYTRQGKWHHSGEGWTNWCEGFLAGELWILFARTKARKWRERAEQYSRLLEPRKHDRSVHDLGFLFMPSWKRWFEVSGDPAIKAVIIEAGRTLARRFIEKGGYLCSFIGPQSLFIDIMMNVGIIFYAAEETGAEALQRLACRHCDTTLKRLVRGDGSVAHEGLFNVETGEFLRQSTHQGWRGDSSWARGLAWALYGFADAYRYTKHRRFLQAARLCADFYLDRTPAHGVPPNDWDEPSPAFAYESSAAAIAASGLWDLAALEPDAPQSRAYRTYALRILHTLLQPEFLASHDAGWEGLLKHGIYHQRKGLGVDESVIWGDYFFLEMVEKYLKQR